MRASGVRRWGGPEALELLRLPTPVAGPGEVRIRVRAAAVNPADLLIRGESAVRMRPGRVLGRPVLPAVRRGGSFVELRPALPPAAAAEARVRLLFALVHDYDGRTDKLDRLRVLASAGVITPRVAGTYPADRAADAHRRQEAGAVGGRLVITFADQ